MKKMEIKWTRGGCLLLSKKNRPFWNTFLLLLLFFLLLLFAPRSLISFFVGRGNSSLHLPVAAVGSSSRRWTRRSLAEMSVLPATASRRPRQATNSKNNGLPMEPSHWSGYHFLPPSAFLFNIQVNSNSQLAHPLIGLRGLPADGGTPPSRPPDQSCISALHQVWASCSSSAWPSTSPSGGTRW